MAKRAVCFFSLVRAQLPALIGHVITQVRQVMVIFIYGWLLVFTPNYEH